MNRKQRRAAQIAAQKQSKQTPANGAGAINSGVNSSGLFAQGVACHQQGRLDEAATLYRQLLKKDPRHADGWYHLGGVAYQQNRWPEAVEHLQQALDIAPDYPEAHNVLGVALKNLGQLEDAFDHLTRAINLQPKFPDAHCNLGNVFMQMDRLEDAVKQYRRAIVLKPEFVLAHSNLGATLLKLRRWDDAISSLKKAVALAPDYAEAHNNLGAAFYEQGHAEQAIVHYQKALELTPEYADAHNNLGNSLVTLERHNEALDHFQQAIALGLNNAEVLSNLGTALHELKRYDDALQQYQQALAINPSYAITYNNMVNTFSMQGKPGEAITYYRKALEHAPEYAEDFNNIGIVYSEQGKIDKALESFQKTIATNPHYTKTYRNIGNLHNYSNNDVYAMPLLRQTSKMDTLTVEEKIHLNYALVKYYQDTGDYDQAFRHFNSGAGLKRKSFDFDPNVIEIAFKGVAHFFDPSGLNNVQHYGHTLKLPVFILGMSRSGTTLIEQILAAHPNVYGAGEVTDFDKALHGFNANKNLWDASSKEAEELAERGQHYAQTLQNYEPNALRITDKMPFNFLNIGLIHLSLPNATIIHCKRDPVDTCLSNFFTYFTEPIDWSYDLTEIGRFYCAYAELMEHWHKILPGRILDVQYEDVVGDLEGQSRRIIESCGLPWDDACLEFQKAERTVRTASMGQVRKPIYTSSVQRWRRYESHLGPLLNALQPVLDKLKAA